MLNFDWRQTEEHNYIAGLAGFKLRFKSNDFYLDLNQTNKKICLISTLYFDILFPCRKIRMRGP